MAMLRVLLRTTVENLEAPERVLSRLNRQLAHTLPAGWFVTACYAVLEPATGRLAYALAGHDPPLIQRAEGGVCERLESRGGPPLGPFPEADYASGRTTLGRGDTLVVYTDGLTEAMSPERELFGVERALAGLAEGRGDPLPALGERLLVRVEAHAAGAPLEDDLTLLLLRRAGQPARGRPAEGRGRAPRAQELGTRV
jgi:sigma-B regulation protein RsbU (phosphoserine phosphatase)